VGRSKKKYRGEEGERGTLTGQQKKLPIGQGREKIVGVD